MTISATPIPTITPDQLLSRVARGEHVELLDTRGADGWTISGPGVHVTQRPSAQLLADPAAAAESLPDDVIVICNRGISARTIAEQLRKRGNNASVLEGGMRGWIGALRAVPVETPVEGVQILQVQRPGRGCLSYVVASGGSALVVDPAPDPATYLELAARLGVTITDVVDTHIHADHLSGARALADQAGATLRLPEAALARGLAYADRITPLRDGDQIQVGEQSLRVVSLPGHTTDMTGLVVGEQVLIGGDSLFADGIARPDLQEGDPEGSRAMAATLYATLHEKVLSLGDDAILLPGHAHPGILTDAVAPTLGQVRAKVPELALGSAAEFAEALVAGMPPRPANYQAIIAVNSGDAPLDLDLESGGNSCSAS
ncbi:MAG: MBL fold metallo-hydrolase [Solirubrobacteraceae bacterium]|nr:MBL fold metallo-hydrolase [Solirubrobacteraceae bacterium]